MKQAVRRNLDRFPIDFMFELTDSEIQLVVSQRVIPSKQTPGGAKPFAFTESGVAMLSGVLNSKRAIEVNISIIRSFVFLRRLASDYSDIMKKLEQLESTYEGKFKEIYKALNYLINPLEEKRQIGFKRKSDK